MLGAVGAALALGMALVWGAANAQAVGLGQGGGTLSHVDNVDSRTVPPSVDAGPSAQSAGPADEAPAPEAQAPAAAPSQGSAATKLVGVEARTSPEGTVLVLKGDGRIDGASSFTLENPNRLVLDIPGIQNAVTTPRIDVGSAEVARVRVAQHDGKVRVVIDGGSAASSFAGRRIEPSSDGLVVTLGGSPGAQPVAASAPEPTAAASGADTTGGSSQATAAEAAPSAAPAPMVHQVTGVKLDAQADKSRVEIDADATVKYQVMRPDKETIVVSLRNATLAEGAQTKIAPEQAGPVSLVTAFAQPKTKKPEVRVVIKRATGAKPTVTRDGDALFVDFPVGDAVAAKPPMLAAPSEAPASAAAPEAASAAPHKAVAQASQAAAPASMESGNAADILQEGGLVNGKEYTGRRISLDLKDVDINDVLRLIAEVSDLNVIAGDEVTGKVTIRLVDVPWDQALDVILLTRGLGFVRVGSVLRIAPSEQLKKEEESRLQERRSHEKLEDLTVKLQPVNYANVDEVEKMVKKLLTARGVVNVDKRTNTVIIKDIPSVIDEATALIKAIDTQTPQVLIEAKIVEANLDFARDVGTTWSFGAQPNVDPFAATLTPRTDLGGSDFLLNTTSTVPTSVGGTTTNLPNNNVFFANPITDVATGLANVGAFLLDQKLNINFQLQAAESNGEGKVISSPRVVTLDNREAKILQGDSIPFQTFQNGDAQLEFIDAVLSLAVTPHITADKSIIMKVEVTRNAPDDSVKTSTGSPAIAKNEAKTETLVADGQTLVIGGIYTVDKAEKESRVPYLFKIPILGNLFKEHEIHDTRKELLIFLTPRVVEHAEVAG
jgi:type IV pilus assembly protein PilQ